MISLEYSYKGFKTVLTNIKSKLAESENPKEIIVTLESDKLTKEYDSNSVPTTRAIRSIFQDAKKILAFIHLDDELFHDQILFDAESENLTPQPQSQPQNLGNDFNPLLQQMKSILQASQEIQDIKNSNLIKFYAEQDEMRAKIYKERENMFLDLKSQEMDLKLKQIESVTKKKSDLMESVLLGLGSGLKEIIEWGKEHPGAVGEFMAGLKTKQVN